MQQLDAVIMMTSILVNYAI